MRKNRTKHEAGKHRAAKRALALCFALIFVCSCLLPAFANSGVEFEAEPADSVVLEEPLSDPEPLEEEQVEPEALDEEPEEEPEEPDPVVEEASSSSEEPAASSEAPAESKEPVEEPAASSSEPSEEPAASSSEEPEEPASSSSASSEAASSTASSSEAASSSASSASSSTASGDVINQGEAAYTYRFWTKEIDAFDLEQIDRAVKDGTSLNAAAKSVAGIAPCKVLKVANNAHLADYTVEEPTKAGYEFAGWYTVENGTEYEFSFDQNVSFEESKTIDVFAKWEKIEPVESTASVNAQEITVKVSGVAAAKKLTVEQAEDEGFENDIFEKLDLDTYPAVDAHIFDLTLRDKNDDVVEPASGEKATVTIKGMELDTSNPVKLYHKTSYGVEDLTDSLKINSDGTLTFTTDSFSPFAVVALGAEAVALDSNPNSPLDSGYMEGRSVYRNNRVFLYVKVEGDTSDLVLNTDGWYTLGYVDLDNDLTMHNRDYVGYWEKTGRAVENAYSTSGDNWDEVIKALGGTNQSVLGWGTSSKVTRYTKNNFIALKDVTWNQSGYGLIATKGATDYGEYVNGTYYGVNGTKYVAWHLDGYLYVSNYANYTVNYYAEVDGENILVDSVTNIAEKGTTVYASNLAAETPTIDYLGKTYKYDHSDPKTSIKIDKDASKNVINLYYELNTLDITITKKVASGSSSENFQFKVTSDNFSTTDNVWLATENGIQQKPQEYFYLKDGESATLHGLKEGYLFTITEEYEYGNAGSYDTTATNNKRVEAGQAKTFSYVVVKDGNNLVLQPTEGSKSKNPLVIDGVTQPNITNGKVVVTNSAAATSLTVSKRVVNGNATAPADAEFTFRLTVATNAKVYQKVKLAKNGEDITSQSVVSGHKNQWEFKLKDGESVHISGIRIDDENVKVEEIINDNHYTTKYKVNSEAETEGTTAAIPAATLAANQSNGTTVEFSNTYNIPKLDSVTITKKVTGEFGERDKNFTFSVTLTDKDGNPVTGVSHTDVSNLESFQLKHGGKVTLKNIPVGTTITITETNADGYKTKATNHDTYVETADRTFTYEVVEKNGEATLVTKGLILNKNVEGNAITVTNNKGGRPDTGILLDTLPYLIILGIAIGGAALLIIRRGKHDDE